MKVRKKITNTFVDENGNKEVSTKTTTEKMKLRDIVSMIKGALKNK